MWRDVNHLIWVGSFAILVFWFFSLEYSQSEIDLLKRSIDQNAVWIQKDTNRIKIYYQLQFIYAPEVLEIKLPKEKPYEVHYKRNKTWHILHFKTWNKS